MNNITFVISPLEEAVDSILELIDDNFNKKDDDNFIEQELYKIFDELKEDLWVIIEYPYVDKIYRDSYYTYFASKHNHYYRDCLRVSFFSDEITNEHFRNEELVSELNEKFLGYLVVRPTFTCPIGRSLISKDAFEENNFITCNYKGSVLVNGVKLTVEGYPHSSQDTESISCAETTIWSVMEYFGNRYPDYKPTMPSNIINVLNKFSKQRLLPSNGLTVDQISFALKEFGFGTSIYAEDDAFENELDNIIAYYIESGIPVIAAIENENIGHATVIIGHEYDDEYDFGTVKTRELSYSDEIINYIDYTDLPKKYVVIDDNLAPYRLIDLNNPVEHYEDDDFKGATIESIVVPLYKKIYLEVINARSLAISIISDANFGYKFKNGFVFRFFLTSSRSFKSHVSKLKSNEDILIEALVLAKMPKFIWVAEIYENNNFNTGKADGLIVIDATEANKNFIDSLLFAGYPDKIFVKSEKDFVDLPYNLDFYTKFKNNLK
ncbi:cysteine peptidase family C39 domain-containing protein [Flavobacterium sedimenticola]|uniref:Papain-like cysteine protease family protein n=1 Tax=Flavobacterium sedimenticola TaxID=3043286 RepID=A0ABT6XN58_9FLAO|nr:papain-like cysteine protease family protein [Flavobacterium sedimenticola]MDI9256516.1 papain-like cysteine protease family protein [Flavobacterium sedimenticola]